MTCVHSWVAWLATVVLTAACGGCATYSDGIGRVERLLADGSADAALKALEQQAGSDQDRVLYLLNRALILHSAGDYRASNTALERAKPLIERNAVISVSEQAGALAVNDSLRAYAGAEYERIYVHVYAALNYLALGQLADARVEALQLDTALGRLGGVAPVPAGFAYYLSGMIFEALGEWDDAMIDYRRAYAAYRGYAEAYRIAVPRALQQDLVRVAARQGFDDELAHYRAEFGIDPAEVAAAHAGKGDVLVVLQSGAAPLRRDSIASVYADDGRLVTVALPYLEPRASLVHGAELHASGRAARSEPVEDIARMAQAELQRELPLITARAIARAVVKNKAIKHTERQGNDALGVVLNVAGLVSERADTRSWSTLPARIHLARLTLAPGRYDLTLELRDAAGVVVGTREYNDVTIAAGDKHVIPLHWLTERDLAPQPSYRRSRR